MNQPAVNLYLITGTDTAGVSNAAAKLVCRFAGKDPDPFCFEHIRETDQSTPAELIGRTISAVLSPPFMGGRKTVYLQDFKWFDQEGGKDDSKPLTLALRRLAEIISKGLPQDMLLIISGCGLDKRKTFFRACKEKGEITFCEKPEITDRKSGAQMRTLILDRAADKNIKLPRHACEHLLEILGTDTDGIDSQLEKIICYTGGYVEKITAMQLQELCPGDGEVSPWALTDALGARSLEQMMRAIDVTLGQEKDIEGKAHGMIIQAAKFFMDLLQIRVFMQERRLRRAQEVESSVSGMSAEEKSACRQSGFLFANMHPYRIKLLAESSLRYSGQELVRAVLLCRDACRQAVSGGGTVSTRIVLEKMLADAMAE